MIKLIRVEELEYGTLGILTIYNHKFCVTLELPDRDNQRNISRIPKGIYNCKRVNSPNFGETFEIIDVPNRSHILFHSGNLAKHTKGCILLAKKFGILEKQIAILDSRNTIREFMSILKGAEEFELEIVEV